MSYRVEPISYSDAKPWIMVKHYAHRMPCVQHAFGLYNGKDLNGIVAYGPTCRSLNNGYGIFGGKLNVKSYELLRLCIDSENKNAASILVGRSLKLLSNHAFVVSYADANKGHVGYVYQATNWLYCGLTSKEKRYIKNGKEIHARTIVASYGTRKANKIPDDIKIEEQEGKHRYVFFIGSKKQRKEMLRLLKYDVLPYPKGDTERYDTASRFHTQQLLF